MNQQGNKRVRPAQASPPLCHGFIPQDQELAGFGKPQGKGSSQANPALGQEKPNLRHGSCRICSAARSECMAGIPSATENQEIPSKQIHRISNKSQGIKEREGGKQVIHQPRENPAGKPTQPRERVRICQDWSLRRSVVSSRPFPNPTPPKRLVWKSLAISPPSQEEHREQGS